MASGTPSGPVDVRAIYLLEASIHQRFSRMRLLVMLEGVAIALLAVALIVITLSLP
ncbi:MAG: hypothetical protein HY532_06475 [Chloroflexi bacterium]|nr:hypothetical protein [Chloroflexota bacterium]